MIAAEKNIAQSQVKYDRISLYYREGNSNKEYHASIEPEGGLFTVNFAYGRRGSTLTTGRKASSPVDYGAAKRIYDRLVREKMSKGYTQGQDGTPYHSSVTQQRVSGMLPQLLNQIDENEAKLLLKDPAWTMQEKFDGRRLLVRKAGPEIHGINRRGLLVGLPETVFRSIRSIAGDIILDGECIGDRLYAFDLLEQDGEDLRHLAYQRRLVKLSSLLNWLGSKHIEFIETATTSASKEQLFRRLKAERKEGVVFKRLDAGYTSGRPSAGGPQLKHKFYSTCSAVVSKINDKRSVELRLLNGRGWNPVGNVTIPVNCRVPEVSQVVEIRYLYAFKESNALYQPVFLGLRKDVSVHECVLSQLKYQPVSEPEES